MTITTVGYGDFYPTTPWGRIIGLVVMFSGVALIGVLASFLANFFLAPPRKQAADSLALTLVPFAGIAFLWFIGVVRDRLGKLEDQFFSTVFFGSGLLFLAMTFASAAIADGILSSYAVVADASIERDVIAFGRAVTHAITNVYATRMAGVFMLALGTIWIRTRLMPRLFVFLTYGLALVMLVSINLTSWLILVFPAWVFVISVYILIVSLRGEQVRADEIVGSTDG